MPKYLLSFLLLGTFIQISAQPIGGDNIYEFLNSAPSARITALGGNLITVRDDDINLAFQNPAALNPSMHHGLAFNFNNRLADIKNGYFAFGQYVNKWDMTFHGGIHYINYGDFIKTDEIGNSEGTFDAAEQAFTVGAGKQLFERMSVGANLKFVNSRFESYNSTGLIGDVAVMIHDTASNVNVTLLAKNIGGQLSTYRPGNREPIPFEMQIGISKKLQYLPFRFSIVYHNLQQWNVLYDDPNSTEDTFFLGEATAASGNDFIDNLFRHLVFSGEFLFGKKENFRLRFAYNHLKRKELTVRSLRSFHGFSLGAGFKISRFRIEYGRSFEHIAGGFNHFSISTNLKEFTRKKRRLKG
ncbi:type IX secretion system protein PorQ [Saprospiraceae bacterium]|jgi:hypothetical protein|nr:type IX secretion system protein PorQ [Saprospiraceae bacterium]